MRELSLKGNEFSNAAGESFYMLLKENTRVTSLNLSWNQFRLDAGVLLIQGLAVCIIPISQRSVIAGYVGGS